MLIRRYIKLQSKKFREGLDRQMAATEFHFAKIAAKSYGEGNP